MPSLPTFQASSGCLLFDSRGRLLIAKPTYKSGWTIPGGVTEADETPWQGCQREVREEVGLEISTGTLVAVDSRPPKKDRSTALRFLFRGPELTDEMIASITLQEEELSQWRLVERHEAITMLGKPLARRVDAAWDATSCVYLEDGEPVPGVQAR